MRAERDGNRKKNKLARIAFGAFGVALLVLGLACQTPPKKANRSSSHASGSTRNASASGLDLFSASPELFGTDPRASRPALVTGTVFAAVGGAAVVLTGAVIASAARAGRAHGPRRSRSGSSS
jgi:hypothetical protein